jgi:hypothetical protein
MFGGLIHFFPVRRGGDCLEPIVFSALLQDYELPAMYATVGAAGTEVLCNRLCRAVKRAAGYSEVTPAVLGAMEYSSDQAAY